MKEGATCRQEGNWAAQSGFDREGRRASEREGMDGRERCGEAPKRNKTKHPEARQ